jgi:hypothetical protein
MVDAHAGGRPSFVENLIPLALKGSRALFQLRVIDVSWFNPKSSAYKHPGNVVLTLHLEELPTRPSDQQSSMALAKKLSSNR